MGIIDPGLLNGLKPYGPYKTYSSLIVADYRTPPTYKIPNYRGPCPRPPPMANAANTFIQGLQQLPKKTIPGWIRTADGDLIPNSASMTSHGFNGRNQKPNPYTIAYTPAKLMPNRSNFGPISK